MVVLLQALQLVEVLPPERVAVLLLVSQLVVRVLLEQLVLLVLLVLALQLVEVLSLVLEEVLLLVSQLEFQVLM